MATLSATSVAAPAPKYKKHTVVDFEEALVEGKSRKPYSAYLYKQKEEGSADLSKWKIDLSKGLELSESRVSE